MAIATEYGPLEKAADCDHPSNCNRNAVAVIPAPNVIGGFRLCDFHLALWADTKGDPETLQEIGVGDLVAENRFLSLEEAPPELDREVRYQRIGVDHRGLAHYHVVGRRDQDDERIITIDAELELVDAYDAPVHIGLEGWIEHVYDRRGWVQLDEEFQDEGGDS